VYVSYQNDGTDVEVFVIDTNPQHIRTKADGKVTNNLLELPTF